MQRRNVVIACLAALSLVGVIVVFGPSTEELHKRELVRALNGTAEERNRAVHEVLMDGQYISDPSVVNFGSSAAKGRVNFNAKLLAMNPHFQVLVTQLLKQWCTDKFPSAIGLTIETPSGSRTVPIP